MVLVLWFCSSLDGTVRHGLHPWFSHLRKGRLRVIVAVVKNQTNYIFLVLPSGRQGAESIREARPHETEPAQGVNHYQHDMQLLR
jgi:hypothetical protein